MKNWIRCIVLTLILIAVAPMSAAAESSRGILDVNGNDVALTLHLPEGKTESITSLRVTLRISAVLGTMDAPRFVPWGTIAIWLTLFSQEKRTRIFLQAVKTPVLVHYH